DNETEVMQSWLIILFHIDADKGKLNLEILLNKQANNALKQELINSLFIYAYEKYTGHCFIQTQGYEENKDYKRVEILEYLVSLAFQYIPLHTNDDRWAKFGKYTPPPEGKPAERMRGKLLRLVENSTGEKAYNLLIKMAKNTSVPFYKDYLHWLALCRAEKDTEKNNEFTQWTEKNIPYFANDVLKAINNEKGFINYKRLRDDLIAIALIEMNSRNAIAKEDEDNTNDRFRNALSNRGYIVADQPRGGDSQSGRRAGERDLVIRNASNRDESIIEAFVLESLVKKTIDGHYEKLIKRYDVVGCATNFVLVYSKTKNFEGLWKKYLGYEKFNEFSDTKDKYSNKSNIRIGISKAGSKEIYHLFINFYSYGKK
ncbi:MAG: hypothetical protein HAW67_02155, partial [Endozoicomonadaceae bacterium]|nr:hypothetical protein [Endozoicomonadaceae bacterium]